MRVPAMCRTISPMLQAFSPSPPFGAQRSASGGSAPMSRSARRCTASK